MQRLLRHADWDTREVRDDVRDYMIEHLGDRSLPLRQQSRLKLEGGRVIRQRKRRWGTQELPGRIIFSGPCY